MSHAREALALSPGSGQIVMLAAFYGAVSEAKLGGGFPAFPELSREGLPLELAALADALEAMGRGDREAVERLLGDHLARFPRSARGYFLLGMWRLHGLKRPDEAAPALKHVAELDPRYMPAAFAFAELMVERDPAQVDAFLEDYQERARDKKWAYRLERHIDRLRETMRRDAEEGPQ